MVKKIRKENSLYDAETVSKWFEQCSVSLSVICPKQLSKRAIYNAAKRRPKASEPAVDVKQPHCHQDPSTVTLIGSEPTHTNMPSMAHPTGPSSSIQESSLPMQNTAAINSFSTVPSIVPTIFNLSDSHPPTNLQGSVNNTEAHQYWNYSANTKHPAINSFSTVPSHMPTIFNLSNSHLPTNLQASVNNTEAHCIRDWSGNVQSMAQCGASENPNMTSSRGTNGRASVTGSKILICLDYHSRHKECNLSG